MSLAVTHRTRKRIREAKKKARPGKKMFASNDAK